MHARHALCPPTSLCSSPSRASRAGLLGLATAALASSLLWSSTPHASAQGAAPAAPPATSSGFVDKSAPPAPDVENFDLEAALVSPDRGLTSDDAGKLARERAPQVASAQASAESARWDKELQESSFYPTVSLSAQYKRISKVENRLVTLPPGFQPPAGSGENVNFNFTQPPDNYSLVASARWPVSELFFRVYPLLKASRSVADARSIEVEARIANADLTAREAFYGHARALATQLVAEQAVSQAEAQAAQAKLFVDAGTVAPVDLMTATARLESMRSALARARGSVAITRNSLATYMGIPTAEISAIRERVTALPDPPTTSVDELLQRGLEQRPELRAMRKTIGANNLLKNAERARGYPVLSVEGANLYGNPNPRYVPPEKAFHNSWEVGATLGWSPNNSLMGHQLSKRASAEVERSRSDLMALEDGVRIEVVQSFEDFKAATEAARASEEQRKAAEESYRVRLATYRVGAGAQIELLEADLALSRARLEHINAVLDARIALARLARATGGPIR